MICMCGGDVVGSLDPIDTEFKGHAITLYDIPHSVCLECGETWFTSDELDACHDAEVAALQSLQAQGN